jgi:hypothetical protein
MALIGEACGIGGVSKRGATSDLRPHTLQATANQITVRRSAEPGAEAARKCIAVEASFRLQRRGPHRARRGVKEFARRIEGFSGEAPPDRGGAG